MFKGNKYLRLYTIWNQDKLILLNAAVKKRFMINSTLLLQCFVMMLCNYSEIGFKP